MQPHNLQLVKSSLISYLSLSCWRWSWVITQTFDDKKVPLHDNICPETWYQFLDLVGTKATCCWGFAFGEHGKVNGRVHWHALLHVQENLFGEPTRKGIHEAMFKSYGRNTIVPYMQLEDFRRVGHIHSMGSGIARYLTKYLAKDSDKEDAWWDFAGFLGGRPADSRQLCSAIGVPTLGA